MKNSTRIFSVLLLTLLSFQLSAGTGNRAGQRAEIATTSDFRHAAGTNHTQSVPFYSQDFSGGLPATWQAVDNAGNGINWRYTTTGAYNSSPGFDTLSSVGTSAANGYMIYDSDSAAGSLGEDADLITETIDCSTNLSVHLTFNQLLVHYAEAAKVFISNDGTTWTEVYDASAGLAQFQATPNPDFVDLDITALAAGQAAVQIKFNFVGNYDFWWMIDDVQLYEPAAAEGGVSAINGPLSSCTLLTAAETVSVEISNYGGADLHDFDVTYIVDNGTPVTETVTDTIFTGSSLSYTFTTPADFSAPGTHTIVAYTTIAGDAVATNDTASSSLYNGAHVANASVSYTMGFEANEDLSTWTVIDANTDGYSWNLVTTFPHSGSVCARMATPTSSVAADDWVFTTCLELNDSTNYDLQYYTRTSSTATQANLEIQIGTDPSPAGMIAAILPQTLVTNVVYMLSVNGFNVPSNGIYYIGFHVTNSDSITSLRLDDINITGSSGVGIQDINNASVAVYPNPSTGMIHLSGTEQSANYAVTVTNTLGQVVFSDNFRNLNNQVIDLSAQAAGQYFIRVITDAGVHTQAVSITR